MDRKIIEGSRGKIALYLLASLTLTVAAALLLLFGDADRHTWKLWLGLAFFGLCSMIMLVLLIRPPRLVLDAEGFRLEGGLRAGNKVAWRHVESFYRWKLPRGGTMVGYRYHDAARPKSLVGGFNRGFGADGALPRTLTLGADALIDELEAWRQRGAGTVPAPVLVE